MTFEDWKNNQIEKGNLWYSSVTSGRTKKGDIIGICKTKYRNKEKNAKKEGLQVLLTFEEYLYKAYEAKIECPSQIGVKTSQYQLARIEDKGNYTKDSCRFLTKKQNEEEKSQDYQLFASKPSSNLSTILAWSLADEVYFLWKEKKLGRYKIAKHFNKREDKRFIDACDRIINTRFKNGWIPTKDEKWINWRNKNV
jgi:hypothetical protein